MMKLHSILHHPKIAYFLFILLMGMLLFTGCTFGFDPNAAPLPTGGATSSGGTTNQGGEIAQVTRIIDGDTIDVKMADGTTERVRYVGMNTPESNEVCFNEATQANAIFVQNQTVRMVKDVSDRDIYGRLLRYIYVGDLFVNKALVEQGYAEAVLYEPDHAYYNEFVDLEKQAAAANRGCHPSGIFNDGSYTR